MDDPSHHDEESIRNVALEIQYSLKEIHDLLATAKIDNLYVRASQILLLPKTVQRKIRDKWTGVERKVCEVISSTSHDFFRRVLEYETVRAVTVKKTNRSRVEAAHVHRQYEANDCLLDNILRLNPREDVLKRLADIFPIYKASKELFDIVQKTTLVDDNWHAFKDAFEKFKSAEGYGLNADEMKRVFLFRHTYREDTILSLCARKNPPFEVIEMILDVGRESVCVVDCNEWDWIPMQYAIAYHARPDVVKALIPTPGDRDFSQCSSYHICAPHSSGQTNPVDLIFEEVDYHGRNPLHWAAYYHAPLETVDALKNACSDTKKVLFTKDHCGHEPYKVR